MKTGDERVLSWSRYGPHALLLRFAECADEHAFHRGQALARRIEADRLAGLVEMTPGIVSLLLEFDPAIVPDPADVGRKLVATLARVPSDPTPATTLLEIPVTYDGPDLARVADHAKLTEASVVELHAAPVYYVHLMGFAPGFPYLRGLDRRLHTPRLPTPRVRVPAGSVAIGGEHTGIYPLETAGGWNLIGRTAVRLFAPEHAEDVRMAHEAFLLKPGGAVRFVPARG